ncbi:MAG: DUF5131 family protein [Myxococcota bacterium]
MEADWVRDIRDPCHDASVPFFFKQWGGARKKEAARARRRRGGSSTVARTTRCPSVRHHRP